LIEHLLLDHVEHRIFQKMRGDFPIAATFDVLPRVRVLM